jgi:transposase-like protein
LAVELSSDYGTLGRARFAPIPDASSSSLSSFIEKNVEPGATVVTDGWRGYSSLEEMGFNHVVTKMGSDKDIATCPFGILPTKKVDSWDISRIS